MKREASELLAYISNNLGGTIRLTRPELGLEALAAPTQWTRVLTLELEEVAPLELLASMPGSWVVMLSTRVIEADPGGRPEIVPVVARLEIGSGGSQQVLEVDAYKAVAPLPGANLAVSVGWDQLFPEYITNAQVGAPTVAVHNVPIEIEVSATVHRSFGQAELLTRTKRLAFANGSSSFSWEVPPFARGWRLETASVDTLALGGPQFTVFEGTEPGNPTVGHWVDRDDDATRIANFARNMCVRPLHPFASGHRFQASMLSGGFTADIVYELGL